MEFDHIEGKGDLLEGVIFLGEGNTAFEQHLG